jgi:hypothetical protein
MMMKRNFVKIVQGCSFLGVIKKFFHSYQFVVFFIATLVNFSPPIKIYNTGGPHYLFQRSLFLGITTLVT